MVLVVLGAVLLEAGVVAGFLNRAFLDPDRFASSVDQLRREPAVSSALGRSLTNTFLQQQPDAVAIRPLIDSVATSVVGSDALSAPIKAAAVSLQRSFTEPSADVFALRVADAGAVLTAVLQRVAPQTTLVNPNVSLVLARIGSQSFAGRTIRLARFVRTASWALPLGGVTVLLLGVLLAGRRRRAVFVAGLSVMALTALLALGLVVGAWWAGSQDEATVYGALIHDGWPIIVGPAWWTLLAVGVIGLLLSASAASLVPEVDPAAMLSRGWRLVSGRPARRAWQVLRSVALLLLGVFVLVRPLLVVMAAGVLAGLCFVLYGVHELAAATNDEELERRRWRRTRTEGDPQPAEAVRGAAPTNTRGGRGTAAAAIAIALALLVGEVVWGSARSSSAASLVRATPVSGQATTCNGYAVLCDRRYDDVAYAASHNSMSTSSDPRWFLPEQGRSIIGQLDDGVRALLIDVWPGFPTVDGKVATARSAYAEAKAQLERDFGAETVAAGLRVVDAVTNPTPAGPESLYLCHGLCELGASTFDTTMAGIKVWLDAHPDEVLTILIEDHVPADAIGQALTASGLAAYAATPPGPGQVWPTLRQMITSGRRLIVMLERGTGGTAYPWLVNAYQRLVQETPYTAPTLADLSTCKPNRGSPQAPLLLVNHWLSGFTQLVSSARRANTTAVLETRLQRCRTERQLPNYVAVNYADIGDLQQVVRQVNGVG